MDIQSDENNIQIPKQGLLNNRNFLIIVGCIFLVIFSGILIFYPFSPIVIENKSKSYLLKYNQSTQFTQFLNEHILKKNTDINIKKIRIITSDISIPNTGFPEEFPIRIIHENSKQKSSTLIVKVQIDPIRISESNLDIDEILLELLTSTLYSQSHLSVPPSNRIASINEAIKTFKKANTNPFTLIRI